MTAGISFDSAEIISLKLRSFNGSKEQTITTQVGEISIYEDVDYPVVRAEITVFDAVAIINDFPIRGEERLEIKFRSRQIDKITTFNFIVYDLSAVVTAGTSSSAVYTLRCASEEYISNAYRVSRTYKDNAHNIIRSLLNSEVKTSKDYIFNPSKGIQDVTIPTITPFAAIDFVRQRSTPAVGTSYLFFENQYGFNFRSFTDLAEERLNESADTLKYQYTYVPGAITLGRGSERYFNLLNVEYLSLVNTTSVINGGVFASKTKIFDIKNKEVITSVTDSSPLFNNSNEFKKILSDKNRELNTYTIVKDSNKPDDYRTGIHALKRDNIVKFNREVVRCHLYGNNELSVGKFIKLKVPVPAVDNKQTFIEGDFLITRLRHILANGPHPTYNVAIDCNKVE